MPAIANNTSANPIDNLPIPVQILIGIVVLIGIAVAGFAVFYLVDILILDADPIGNAVAAIAHAAGK